MGKVISFLSGKKTYILSTVALALAALLQYDVVTRETYELLLQVIAPLGVITLRAGMKK